MEVKDLKPELIWKYFDEITKIPRPSRKEEKIIEYLLNFAKEHNLEAQKDDSGNVIIRKPATKGKENIPSVVMQSHSDMVCEKNSDTVHDFDNDPINTYIEGNWVKAKGTTLGGDDGIGIAASLAVLASNDLNHGPIEALFTSDEETGMTGAFGLKKGFIKSKILLNLDSEDEGELFIGCAGGVDTSATFEYNQKEIPKNSVALKISVTGLKGGQSGDEINKELGNSNKILNRILYYATKNLDLKLNDFNGGNLRNAIPREAFAVVVLPKDNLSDFNIFIDKFIVEIKNEYSVSEPTLKVEFENCEMPKFVIDKKTQKKLIHSIFACSHGVFAMSLDMPGMVETSTNLASVKFKPDNQIFIETSQRSSVESAKWYVAQTVNSVFTLAGAKVKHGEGYPGWKPNTNSKILKITEDSYQTLFGVKPVVRAIHAGLECGLFLEKYPDFDMISFGPTVKGAHSPDERMDIETVKKFWDLLVDVLQKIN